MDRKLKYMIMAKSRQCFQWSPERRAAKKRAQLGKGLFVCEGCRHIIANEDASEADKAHIITITNDLLPEVVLVECKEAVDHINPVIEPSEGFSGWDEYYRRLFCSSEELQVLCQPCHYIKTQIENDERRERKNES